VKAGFEIIPWRQLIDQFVEQLLLDCHPLCSVCGGRSDPRAEGWRERWLANDAKAELATKDDGHSGSGLAPGDNFQRSPIAFCDGIEPPWFLKNTVGGHPTGLVRVLRDRRTEIGSARRTRDRCGRLVGLANRPVPSRPNGFELHGRRFRRLDPAAVFGHVDLPRDRRTGDPHARNQIVIRAQARQRAAGAGEPRLACCARSSSWRRTHRPSEKGERGVVSVGSLNPFAPLISDRSRPTGGPVSSPALEWHSIEGVRGGGMAASVTAQARLSSGDALRSAFSYNAEQPLAVKARRIALEWLGATDQGRMVGESLGKGTEAPVQINVVRNHSAARS
jgi:hypothetical protein